MRRPDKALACFAQAAAVDPRAINPRISLAVLYETSYRLEETRAAVDACLATQALLREAGPAGTGKLLLDKNPSPTARLPLWLKVLPELRVLVALRDPRDVVLSCYFQNIPLNATNVNFLSFERLAEHYADLMDIWLAVRV
jgi:Sulfotransferase family